MPVLCASLLDAGSAWDGGVHGFAAATGDASPPASTCPSLSRCATSQGQLQQCLRGAAILGKYLVIFNCSAGGSPLP